VIIAGVRGKNISRPRPVAARIIPPFPLYVDTEAASGGDGNRATPYASLSDAVTACSGFADWRIIVNAPITDPVRSQIDYDSSFGLTIEGDDLTPWYSYGSEIVDTWTDAGSGVYSKVLNWTDVNPVFVPTMTQTVGDVSTWMLKLVENTATPTTPSAGEFGFLSGVLYIHLPDSENPALHVIEAGRRNFGFFAYGSGRLNLKNVISRGNIISGALVGLSTQPDGTGKMTIEDSLFEYSENGPAASGKFESLICTRVKSYRHNNDGYNIHAAVPGGAATLSELNQCIGSYNGDSTNQSSQGASAHEACTMTIRGGSYNYNVSGGMVSIDDAVVNFDGATNYGAVLMDQNMRLGNVGGTIQLQASCAWMDNCTGSVVGSVTVSNGQGIGVKTETVDAVTGIENINSDGNALPDEIA
jgi:hypothetical protein